MKIVFPLAVLKGIVSLLWFVLLFLVTESGDQPGPGQALENTLRQMFESEMGGSNPVS